MNLFSINLKHFFQHLQLDLSLGQKYRSMAFWDEHFFLFKIEAFNSNDKTEVFDMYFKDTHYVKEAGISLFQPFEWNIGWFSKILIIFPNPNFP